MPPWWCSKLVGMSNYNHLLILNYIGEANMSNSVGLAEVPSNVSSASVEPSSSIACSCPTDKVSIFLS